VRNWRKREVDWPSEKEEMIGLDGFGKGGANEKRREIIRVTY
jgi:hypothetical protein